MEKDDEEELIRTFGARLRRDFALNGEPLPDAIARCLENLRLGEIAPLADAERPETDLGASQSAS